MAFQALPLFIMDMRNTSGETSSMYDLDIIRLAAGKVYEDPYVFVTSCEFL